MEDIGSRCSFHTKDESFAVGGKDLAHERQRFCHRARQQRLNGTAAAGCRSAILHAVGSDHDTICQFLATIFRGSAAIQFRTSLGDPSYQPRDRLLLKHAGRMVRTSTSPAG